MASRRGEAGALILSNMVDAKGDCIDSMSVGEGLPVTSNTRSNWFMVEVPGKMGFPLISSPKMQPHAHMSTPVV